MRPPPRLAGLAGPRGVFPTVRREPELAGMGRWQTGPPPSRSRPRSRRPHVDFERPMRLRAQVARDAYRAQAGDRYDDRHDDAGREMGRRRPIAPPPLADGPSGREMGRRRPIAPPPLADGPSGRGPLRPREDDVDWARALEPPGGRVAQASSGRSRVADILADQRQQLADARGGQASRQRADPRRERWVGQVGSGGGASTRARPRSRGAPANREMGRGSPMAQPPMAQPPMAQPPIPNRPRVYTRREAQLAGGMNAVNDIVVAPTRPMAQSDAARTQPPNRNAAARREARLAAGW